MTKESLIKDLLILGNLYNTNEEIENAVFERALSIFDLYESEVKILNIPVVMGQSEQLINFLIHLNDKRLINNHDFDYEKEVKKYIKNY